MQNTHILSKDKDLVVMAHMQLNGEGGRPGCLIKSTYYSILKYSYTVGIHYSNVIMLVIRIAIISKVSLINKNILIGISSAQNMKTYPLQFYCLTCNNNKNKN